MQTETTATTVDTTTTAPAGTTETSQTTTTPPASGQGDAGQGSADTGTSSTAEGQAEGQGKQQDGAEGTANTDPADRDDQGRYKSKVQKRIDELTHARHTAEREAARWRSIAEGRQATPAPQAHEFASDADYEAALRRHEIKEAARQEVAENARSTADQYQQDAARAVDDTYNQRVQAAVTRIPDFVDVVGKADIKISADMLQALKESDHGPDIVYQLAKNPAEAERLASMNTRQLDREIGRMEAAIAAKVGTAPAAASAPAAAAAPAARTTNAPPPVRPGAPAAAAPANNDPSTMNQEQYEAWRRQQGSRYIR